MLVKFQHGTSQHTVDLDKAYIWVTIEDDLKLTVDEAQEKMGAGSLKVISYALWVASNETVPFKEWVKDLGDFTVIEEAPKGTDAEVSGAS